MKWSKAKVEEMLELMRHGYSKEQTAKKLGCTTKAALCKLQKIGYKLGDFPFYIKKETVTCACCSKTFTGLKRENRKYCSSSCAAKVNNKLAPKRKKGFVSVKELARSEKAKQKKPEKAKQKKPKKPKLPTSFCLVCTKEVAHSRSYCSMSCHRTHKREILFLKVEAGDKSVSSNNAKRYLVHKHGPKCQQCGWDKKHPVTGNVPIELEHKDGNSENNHLSNLELLCPNCHSLTPTYRNLNAGKGRHSRRERYKSGKSY